MINEPLTPEERALAQRLARLGPHGEPSPTVDARILAAAHAAAAPPPRKRVPRWPVAFGVAASLALAVGIAWQLRPLPEATVYDEAASAQTAASSDMATTGSAEMAKPAAELPAAEFGKPPAAREAVARGVPAPESAAAAAADAEPQAFPPAPPPPPQEPEVVLDEPAPLAAPAAPPAPPAAATTARQAAPPAAARENDVRGLMQQKAAEAEPATDTLDTLDTFEADEEVVPPATADSPQVREAWLERIRELMQAGKTEEARASLREFRHRYPAHPIPEDLRALAE